MLFILYIVVAYICLSTLQSKAGIFYFGSLGNYFFGKVAASIFLGFIIIPVCLIMALLGRLR